MSLNWQLHAEGATTGDLSDRGDSLFPLLTLMMEVGTPRLTTDEELKTFVDRYIQISTAKGSYTKDQTVLVKNYARELKVMELTSNVSRLTDTQFNKRLVEALKERSKTIRKGLDN